jgi:toxin ParE1/3/4
MDFELVWAEPAVADLQSITEYIAQHNPEAAERTANAILQAAELLKTVPLMGAFYPRGSQGRTRYVVSGKYRIFYRVDEEARRVEILTVRHGARQDPVLPDE